MRAADILCDEDGRLHSGLSIAHFAGLLKKRLVGAMLLSTKRHGTPRALVGTLALPLRRPSNCRENRRGALAMLCFPCQLQTVWASRIIQHSVERLRDDPPFASFVLVVLLPSGPEQMAQMQLKVNDPLNH